MLRIDSRIKLLKKFVNLIDSHDTFANQNDIRSISTNALGQITQNYLFSLILSKKLLDLSYCKDEISIDIKKTDLPTFNFNFNGFVKDAFFNSFFLHIENHIRQIAIHYETPLNQINKPSIKETFENLLNEKKISLFVSLTNEDLNLFKFYCYLRNTMHSLGFQTKIDSNIIIKDNNSIFNKKRIEIKLTKDLLNNLTFEKMILLQEQIFKLIIKMNSLLPENDDINHRLSSSYN